MTLLSGYHRWKKGVEVEMRGHGVYREWNKNRNVTRVEIGVVFVNFKKIGGTELTCDRGRQRDGNGDQR